MQEATLLSKEPMLSYSIGNIFEPSHVCQASICARDEQLRREVVPSDARISVVLDRLSSDGIACAFIRFAPTTKRHIKLSIDGNYHFKSCMAGGWLALPSSPDHPLFWVPQGPAIRRLDKDGHILSERPGQIAGYGAANQASTVSLGGSSDGYVDCVIWMIPGNEIDVVASLQSLNTLERQSIFLWGSHTIYAKPADVYLHLIFGHVYENRYLWPYHRKSCSENDAHALFVTLSGLQRATGKMLYGLLKHQLLLSVLARQSGDGGWHHGEWSEDMEAHIRLNGSAIHLLVDSLQEREDPVVAQALQRAVDFLSRHKDETAVGAWFLHDSLELTEAAMKKSPFRWAPGRALGKSTSNMLVLNTHLDSLVLLDRYREVTRDRQYDQMIESAKAATRAVLNLRPLNPLYWVLIQLIRLTLLPVEQQKSLPLPIRALKRIVWKCLIPNLFHLTVRFPRFVMPGGYIERAVALQGMANDYHSINVLDLARYWRRFPSEEIATVLDDAVNFVKKNNIQYYWEENKWRNYALGFWAEALYHRYLLHCDRAKLVDLAEIVVQLGETGMGLPPSLLGANREAVPLSEQVGCPSPADLHLRVANLSRDGRAAFLVANPTLETRRLTWETPIQLSLHWETSDGKAIENIEAPDVPSRGWIFGQQNAFPCNH